MIDIILCKDQMENVQIIDEVQYLRLTLREQLVLIIQNFTVITR